MGEENRFEIGSGETDESQRDQFVFFDFGQPRLRFMADYASMMCLFACVGAALSKGLKMLKQGISKDE